jgi:hypothetical protein
MNEMLSDHEIVRLIGCQKAVTKRPRTTFLIQGRHRRNDFEVSAVDTADRFAVFMRQSLEFPENFSVGLDYLSLPGSGRLCLIRCNGPHGEHREIPGTPDHHFSCHIHVATSEALQAGLRPESNASRTDAFTTFEEAVAYFVRRCSIVDVAPMLPFLSAELNRREPFREEDG